MPADRPWSDTDVQAGARAITAALGNRPWRTMTPRKAAIAVLGAVAPPIAARVQAEERADAYESAARIVGDLGIGRPCPEAAALREASDLLMAEAAVIARAHRTTPTEETTDGV